MSGADARKLSVLLVIGQRLVRAGCERILRERYELNPFNEAENGEQAIHAARVEHPDLVLIDFRLPGISGVEAARTMLADDPALKIILLIDQTALPSIQQFVSFGIRGFLSKDNRVDDLFEAIDSVLVGDLYMAPGIATKMAFGGGGEEVVSPFQELSPRELEIVMMILDGKRNQQMAASLSISDKTVSTYRSRALKKLDVNSTAELALLAMRYGLINPA